MSDWSMRRRFPRYPIQLPLQHTTPAAGAGVGWTRNLSEGGACVELDECLPVPSPVHIRLLTDRGAIDIEAQVVWEAKMPDAQTAERGLTGGGVLHGVTFTHLAPDQLQVLRSLLLPPEQGRRSGPRLPMDLPVTCRTKGSEGTLLQGRTENMSRGGLLLRLSQSLSPGTALSLTLHPPHGMVTAEGEIVWTEPPENKAPGEPIRHGLQFTALGWSSSLSLALLVTTSK
jgi:hypothetical protein